MKKYLKGIISIKGNKLEIIASDETLDRQGEIIPIDSWDLSNFMKSPRLLVDHDYSVKSIVGAAKNLRTEASKLIFEPVFHTITELAKTTKEMVMQGFLDTVSVGYMEKEIEGKRMNELLEISFVAVPANPNARMLAYKAMDKTEESEINKFLVEIVKTSKNVCDPDSDDYDPDKCEEMKKNVCDPDSPDYDPEMCEELKGEHDEEGDDEEEDEEDKQDEDDDEEDEEEEDEEKKQEGTEVQTVILSKEVFGTLAEAEKWAEENDFRHDKVDETEDSWRFRQFEPTECQDGSFRTIELTDGVSAVICRPKEGRSCKVNVEDVNEKAGRVLSKKNRELISNSIQSMKQSMAVLEKLLEATEPPSHNESGKSSVQGDDEQRSKSDDGLVVISRELIFELKEALSHQRIADKHNELSNAVIKRILKSWQ